MSLPPPRRALRRGVPAKNRSKPVWTPDEGEEGLPQEATMRITFRSFFIGFILFGTAVGAASHIYIGKFSLIQDIAQPIIGLVVLLRVQAALETMRQERIKAKQS
jgi:hypothetical protein